MGNRLKRSTITPCPCCDGADTVPAFPWDWDELKERAERASGAVKHGGHLNSVGVPADAFLYLLKRAFVAGLHRTDES